MPYADNEKQKDYHNKMHRINITMSPTKENTELFEIIGYAANNRDLTLPKYALFAIREQLKRDGYI